jgi:capsular polysaccharide export protein
VADQLRRDRQFLFLQGPPGPFFRKLAVALKENGAVVHRINLSGGDRFDWPGSATDYRGRLGGWAMFFDRFVQIQQITDLVLFGDCRPLHKIAVTMAKLRDIRIHVFEEGYMRPDWMTLERDGVNGSSLLNRDPERIKAEARQTPSPLEPKRLNVHPNRRAIDSYLYYHHVITGRIRFPFYRSHRHAPILLEGVAWLWKLSQRRRVETITEKTLANIKGRSFFLFPLQLTGDYQIRVHSPFGSMPAALEHVLESFGRSAPPQEILLIKEHPLDSTFIVWRHLIRKHANRLGISNRIFFIPGGDINSLIKDAVGMVCVNSTSGLIALEVGLPVVTLGDAIYDVCGLTHHQGLDSFWDQPTPPDANLYTALKCVLQSQCLVYGGLDSEMATDILVQSSLEKLLFEANALTISTSGNTEAA